MRNSLLFLFIVLSQNLFAQESKWKLQHFYKSTAIDAWDVDPMGKVILAEKDVLVKLDTSFLIQFTQSTKQLGEVATLDAAHSLKTLVFSELQQYVSFVDNTLTFQEGIKDLSNYGVAYATNVGYSSQTNRFWIYDGDNSQLLLIDETGNQISKINNLSSITGAVQPKDLFEKFNQLMIFYEGVGVFFFDIYGSLISHFPMENASSVHFTKESLYFVVEDKVVKINRSTEERQAFDLPDKDISGIRVLGNSLFLEVPNGIKKYSLIPH